MGKTRRPGSSNQAGCGAALLFFLGIAGCIFAFPTLAMALNDGWEAAAPITCPLLAISFVGFAGGAFMVWWKRRYTSVEHSDSPSVQDHEKHPNWPKVKTASGVRATKLSAAVSPHSKFIMIMLIALFWNGITWAAVIGIMSDGPSGGEFLLILVFLGVFVLIGLVLLGASVHTFLRMFLVGGTTVEITKEPLLPGDSAQYFIVQSGDFQITELVVMLECIEQARYRQGSSTTTVEDKVLELELAREQNVQARDRLPCHEGRFEIPPEAMHSFKASHNSIVWRLVVTMDIPNKPDVEDEFEFRVAPGRSR